MTLPPLIQRPCPYVDRLDSVMEGDFCSMCRRQVHDLTAMDDAGRAGFLASCGGDACISYKMSVRPALAAALIAASAAVLVAPEAALARHHPAGHGRHHQPTVRTPNVMVATAGLPAPPLLDPPPVPAPRPPAEPGPPPPNPQ